MDGEEQQRKASARLAESLGWLAESAIQPRKRNTIEGKFSSVSHVDV